MRVYHFLNRTYGLKDIQERRLKIATFLELNDPFEFLSLELADPRVRETILKTKRKLARRTGLLCFSKGWSNPVQWSHYADRHRGLCLGFDVPDDQLVRVTYSSKRLSEQAARVLSGGSFDERLLLQLLSTKFYHWRYENEFRCFRDLKKKDASGCYFAEFSDDLALREVIIGSLSSITRAEVFSSMGDYQEEVEVFKARPAFKSFRIVRSDDESSSA